MNEGVENANFQRLQHFGHIPDGMCCAWGIALFYRAIHSYGMKKRKYPTDSAPRAANRRKQFPLCKALKGRDH
jgi:hypothetical protein